MIVADKNSISEWLSTATGLPIGAIDGNRRVIWGDQLLMNGAVECEDKHRKESKRRPDVLRPVARCLTASRNSAAGDAA